MNMINRQTTRKIIAICVVICFAGVGIAQAHVEPCAKACCASNSLTEKRLHTHRTEGPGQHGNCRCKTGIDPYGGAEKFMYDSPGPAASIFESNQPFVPFFSFVFDRLSVSMDFSRSMAGCCDFKEGSNSDLGNKAAFSTPPRMGNPQSSGLSQIFSVSIETEASQYRYLAFCRIIAMAESTPVYLENLTFLI
jgi:hypothetical protein